MRAAVSFPKARALFFALLCLITTATLATEPDEASIVAGHPIEVRKGMSPTDPVIGTLVTGEKVRIVRMASKERRAQIERSQGESGWVALDDLSASPPPITDAPVITGPQTLESLRQQLALLQTELAKTQTASIEILRIQAERDQLQSEVIHLKRDLERLRQENSALDADETQVWFLMGGAILFGGVLLGILLPRLHVRQRNQWSSF